MERIRFTLRLAAIGILVAIAVLAAAGPAGAHAEVRESDPEIGGEVAAGVAEIEITFIEMDPAGPMTVEVIGPDGVDRVSGDLEVDGQVMVVPVTPLEVGEHRVVWEVRAADGHGTSDGEYAFTVVEPAGGSFGVWLLWIVALAIPAAIFLRPGARKAR